MKDLCAPEEIFEPAMNINQSLRAGTTERSLVKSSVAFFISFWISFRKQVDFFFFVDISQDSREKKNYIENDLERMILSH